MTFTMQSSDYTREVRLAHVEIERAAMLVESGSLSDVEQAGAAIECAAAHLTRVRTAPPEAVMTASFDAHFSSMRRDLRRLHALMDNAAGFFQGWTALAALSPVAYTAGGSPPELAIPRSVSLEG